MSLGKMITSWKTRRELNKRYNKTVSELSMLSGRDLADLGIHRSQIEEIAMQTVFGK